MGSQCGPNNLLLYLEPQQKLRVRLVTRLPVLALLSVFEYTDRPKAVVLLWFTMLLALMLISVLFPFYCVDDIYS